KGRGDRGVRLVDGHPHRGNLHEPLENGVGHDGGCGLDQSITLAAESAARRVDDLIVANRKGELVGAGGFRELDVENDIELEGLAYVRLVRHHSVVGVEHKPGHEYTVAHRVPRIAAATRNA